MESYTKGRIMGLDYGEKRIGVAISDELRLFARPLENIERKGDKILFARLHALAEEWAVHEVVLGLPTNMDGTRSRLSEQVASFAGKLQKEVSLPLHWVDERLSSQEAENLPAERNTRPDHRARTGRVRLDSRAAALILQRFLDGEQSADPFSV